jgi:SAM-dependent methyltransferase
MSLKQSRVHWEDMGDLDPCWAILTEPGTKHGKWELQKFFATGRAEIAALKRLAERFKVPTTYDWALDFGCGLGRVSRALAEQFRHVVGVDISRSMIKQAAVLNPQANCHFLVNDSEDLPFPSQQFDLIYTVLVLQHVPKQDSIRRYVSEFVRVLRQGGLLVMQLPSAVPLRRRLQARPRLYAWLRKAGISGELLYNGLGLHPIPMKFLPETNVVSILQSGGGRVLEIVDDERAGPNIPSRTYYATRNA